MGTTLNPMYPNPNPNPNPKNPKNPNPKIRISLRTFHEAHGVAPKLIIFYCDGVAHNQLDDVETHELFVSKRACALEGGENYLPFITFVVVQQRTRARFAVECKHNFENVPSGTVVDKDVIDNTERDIYYSSK